MEDKNGTDVTEADNSELTDDEKIEIAVRQILNKYRRAFEELAK